MVSRCLGHRQCRAEWDVVFAISRWTGFIGICWGVERCFVAGIDMEGEVGDARFWIAISIFIQLFGNRFYSVLK